MISIVVHTILHFSNRLLIQTIDPFDILLFMLRNYEKKFGCGSFPRSEQLPPEKGQYQMRIRPDNAVGYVTNGDPSGDDDNNQ